MTCSCSPIGQPVVERGGRKATTRRVFLFATHGRSESGVVAELCRSRATAGTGNSSQELDPTKLSSRPEDGCHMLVRGKGDGIEYRRCASRCLATGLRHRKRPGAPVWHLLIQATGSFGSQGPHAQHAAANHHRALCCRSLLFSGSIDNFSAHNARQRCAPAAHAAVDPHVHGKILVPAFSDACIRQACRHHHSGTALRQP